MNKKNESFNKKSKKKNYIESKKKSNTNFNTLKSSNNDNEYPLNTVSAHFRSQLNIKNDLNVKIKIEDENLHSQKKRKIISQKNINSKIPSLRLSSSKNNNYNNENILNIRKNPKKNKSTKNLKINVNNNDKKVKNINISSSTNDNISNNKSSQISKGNKKQLKLSTVHDDLYNNYNNQDCFYDSTKTISDKEIELLKSHANNIFKIIDNFQNEFISPSSSSKQIKSLNDNIVLTTKYSKNKFNNKKDKKLLYSKSSTKTFQTKKKYRPYYGHICYSTKNILTLKDIQTNRISKNETIRNFKSFISFTEKNKKIKVKNKNNKNNNNYKLKLANFNKMFCVEKSKYHQNSSTITKNTPKEKKRYKYRFNKKISLIQQINNNFKEEKNIKNISCLSENNNNNNKIHFEENDSIKTNLEKKFIKINMKDKTKILYERAADRKNKYETLSNKGENNN